jgi:hypothetical protein
MSKGSSNQTKSDNVPAESEDEARRKRKSPLLHPYLQLFISIILTAASQIFLKTGVETHSLWLPGTLFPTFSLIGFGWEF